MGSAFLKINISCAQSPLTFGSANMLYSIKRNLTRTFIAVLCLHISSCTCPTWRQNAVNHKMHGSRLVDFNLLPSCQTPVPKTPLSGSMWMVGYVLSFSLASLRDPVLPDKGQQGQGVLIHGAARHQVIPSEKLAQDHPSRVWGSKRLAPLEWCERNHFEGSNRFSNCNILRPLRVSCWGARSKIPLGSISKETKRSRFKASFTSRPTREGERERGRESDAQDTPCLNVSTGPVRRKKRNTGPDSHMVYVNGILKAHTARNRGPRGSGLCFPFFRP